MLKLKVLISHSNGADDDDDVDDKHDDSSSSSTDQHHELADYLMKITHHFDCSRHN